MKVVMSRIGFDSIIHPYQLQLRVCSILDPDGIQNSSCDVIDFREGRVTEYNTDDEKVSTIIREYIASDDELKELYAFFTLKAIKEFEAMSDDYKRQYEIGYYDCAYLRYLLIGEDGQLSDGVRRRVYSIDPIHLVYRWMRKISPFEQA